MKRHIITLSGGPGSGKSSAGDVVARALGYQRFSSGDFMRRVAEARGMTLEELGALAEHDSSIDTAIDDEIKKTAEGDNLVIDSRLAYHWIPEAFKVYLKLDLHIAAKRIHDQIHLTGRVGQNQGTEDEIYERMIARIESEKKRYHEYYGVDYTNEKNFDLVVDTGIHPVDKVAQIIIDAYRAWSAQ